jgi:hypothetical protein
MVRPETDDLKIYGGRNFIAVDIEDSVTLVSTFIYIYLEAYIYDKSEKKKIKVGIFYCIRKFNHEYIIY